jgi:hypothetical protein
MVARSFDSLLGLYGFMHMINKTGKETSKILNCKNRNHFIDRKEAGETRAGFASQYYSFKRRFFLKKNAS